MRSSWASLLPMAILAVCSASSATAQSWGDILKEKAAQRAVSAADQAIDQTQQQGKEVEVTNQSGQSPPPDQQPRAASPAGAGQSGTSSGAHAGSSASQPNLTAVKSDFVPGNKLIFYDDFTDMRGDEPPPHWKVRGGTAELRT